MSLSQARTEYDSQYMYNSSKGFIDAAGAAKSGVADEVGKIQDALDMLNMSLSFCGGDPNCNVPILDEMRSLTNQMHQMKMGVESMRGDFVAYAKRAKGMQDWITEHMGAIQDGLLAVDGTISMPDFDLSMPDLDIDMPAIPNIDIYSEDFAEWSAEMARKQKDYLADVAGHLPDVGGALDPITGLEILPGYDPPPLNIGNATSSPSRPMPLTTSSAANDILTN